MDEQRPFACELCGSRFARKDSLQNHLNGPSHGNHRPYKCGKCPKTFTRSSDRTRHESGSHSKTRFPCFGRLPTGEKRGCGSSFSRQYTLSKHQEECRPWIEGEKVTGAAPLWSRLAFPSIEATAMRRELVGQLREGKIRRCIVCDATRTADDLPSFLLHLIGHLEDILYRSFACQRCGASFPLEPLFAEHQKLCSSAAAAHHHPNHQTQNFQCFKTSVVVDKHGSRMLYVWGCNAVAYTQNQYDQHIQGRDATACSENRAQVIASLRAQIMNQISYLKPQASSIARDDLGSYLKALRRQIYLMDADTSGDEHTFCLGCDQVLRAASGEVTGQGARVDGADTQFLINALGVAELFEEVGG